MVALKTATRSRFLIGALQYPGYRKYWASGFAAILGENVRLIAHFWLAWELTKSNFFLGLLGLAAGVPSLLTTLISGQVADRVDRRNLLLCVQFLNALVMLALGILIFTDAVNRWHVLLFASTIGVIQTFYVAARSSIMPGLVEPEDLSSAVAFDISTFQGSRVVAPPIAAGLIYIGVENAFYFIALANIVGCLILLPLKVERIVLSAENRGLQAFSAGFTYIRQNSLFGTFTVLSVSLGFFGLGFAALLPSFADDVHDTGAAGFAVLSLSFGVGSLAGSLIMALVRQTSRKGYLIFGGIVVFASFEIIFALSGWFPLSALLLLIMGLAYSIFIIFSTSEIQMHVPDELRGRVMSIWSLTWLVIPLGGFVAGSIAAGLGPQGAIAVTGGVLLAVAVVMGVLSPQARDL